ncbi:MAG: HDOD domain-containing protein [Burkholderiales bacterium]|nr:HDOD domain-containing protein [Burkholderiales bacterium]
MPTAAAHTTAAASPTPARAFGRYQLRRLLGKSEATMSWLADDAQAGHEVMLTLPRVAPAGAGAIASWLATARRAARLDHPGLARVLECNVHEQWPFVVVDRRAGVTLDEWLAEHARPAIDEAALWVEDLLRALAFAHDAGIVHLDPQFHTLLVNERGQLSVMALSVAHEGVPAAAANVRDNDRAMPLDPSMLRAQRSAAERDVLACGLLLHRLLAGEPALGVADTGKVIERLAPLGREFVRLPWTTPQPIPEALRAIVNRSTAGQVRLRYRNARTFLGALNGWREAVSDDDGGPVALLLDRLRTVGHLPSLPGLGARVQRVTAIESQRTDEIAAHLLPDLALSFELLRTINTAQVQGTQISGNGPVLTLRRVVALIGVNGVRLAANSLREWPGPLDETGAKALLAAIDRVRLAGHTAQALRPAGYDGEVVYLIAALQNLGRLMLRYHFAEEAEQIQQLMQPAPATAAGPEQPGLDEAGASYAVLGVDVETFGFAVARHWGLGEEILHMIRRLPLEAPVRKPDGDAELLRIVASAANEIVDIASHVPARKMSAAFTHVAQRYSRVLRINTRAIVDALQEAKDVLRKGGAAPAGRSAGKGEDAEAAVEGPRGDPVPAAAELPPAS